MKTRYLQDVVAKDALASQKIAFVTGPRQVGKTFLSKALLKIMGNPSDYYTWDDDEFKLVWSKMPKILFQDRQPSLVVFDEIHKDRQWKTRLKGLFDLFGDRSKILVTGSARLDYFRKSGDSLQGRYIPYRLHPFTYGESALLKSPPSDDWEEHSRASSFSIRDLLNLGGFPEPLLQGDSEKAMRWRRLHRERMIREDARDLNKVREIESLDLLSLLLTESASGQLSYESLRQDLKCSFEAVKRWIEILEALYFSFRIKPYSNRIKNSLRKEPKLFLTDWSMAKSEGAKWENLIASHLLKSVHGWTDCGIGEFEIYYIRDKQKREVDFFVTQNGKPYLLVEVKSGHNEPTSSLVHFNSILKPKFCIQVVRSKTRERGTNLLYPNIRVMSGERFLSALN